MTKSLIRKNQLHPDISDLVSGYGDNFFITPAELNSTIIAAQSAQGAVLISGNQTITGIKTFVSRPIVNGTGVLLSGEVVAQLPNTIVYNTGNQTISGNKTFRNSIFYGLASGSLDLGLRTNISSGSGDSVSFTRGGTIPSVHGYGIVFEGGSIANKKGYLTVGATVAPVDYQYASLDWTNRILSGGWSASSPIRVGSAVSVMTTGNQTISGVKTFATKIEIGDFSNAIYVDSSEQSLVISGYQTTLRTLKLIAASPSYETSILFGPGEDGLAFRSPNYTFYDTRPKILYSGDFTSRDVALLDEVVLNTGNQTISGVKTFTSNIFAPNLVYNSGDYNYFTTSITLGNNYINLANSTSGITGTLPSITSGRNYIVKNLNTGTLTVTGSNSIDGNVNLKLYKNESAHLLGVNNIGFTGWVSLNTNPGIS